MLGRDAHETDEPRAGSANYLEQKQREPRQRIIASSENPNICPRVEIVFNRQQEEVLLSAPVAKLGTIGVLFPADAAQQFAIGGMETDEVAAAAMVRPDNKLLRRQLHESVLDVDCAKPRAIPPDGDNFVIAKLRDSFDRVLKARRECAARLPVNAGPGSGRILSRSEEVEINLR